MPTSSIDPNGVQTLRKYDGFGRFREQTSPDGNNLSAQYAFAGGNLRLSVISVAGEQKTLDYDRLGRVVRRRTLARDDGVWVVRDLQYDTNGQIAAVSLPFFEEHCRNSTHSHMTHLEDS
jgi:YD repeat-containing protein